MKHVLIILSILTVFFFVWDFYEEATPEVKSLVKKYFIKFLKLLAFATIPFALLVVTYYSPDINIL